MKKLNNKGITTIEVLICFVLVVVITMSIYATVSGFNERKILEGQKEKIYSYKNTLTKEIQDDFIKKGLTSAKYEKVYYYYVPKDEFSDELISEDEYRTRQQERQENGLPDLQILGTKTVHVVNCTLKDGSERRLEIEQLFALSPRHMDGSIYKDDEFMIRYGAPDDMINWDLPDVGYSGYHVQLRKECDVDTISNNCRKSYDLSINNVIINTMDDSILSIYIGFYHPEFATRYAINIVCPINYVLNESDSSTSWEY